MEATNGAWWFMDANAAILNRRFYRARQL